MNNWNKEMMKKTMTEIANRNQMQMEELGEEINKRVENLINTKENEKSIKDFIKAMQQYEI